MAGKVPTLTLNDGLKIPKIGYGLGTANYGKDSVNNVLSALEVGYDYIDCAQRYANSASFAEGFKRFGGKREDVFVLQKCGKTGAKTDPRKVLEGLLKEMNLEYVDLYLLHSPLLFEPLSLSEAWAIMEKIKEDGLAKSIGVSNFREEDMQEIKKTWKVAPSVNQIEFHPYNYHPANMQRLVSFLKEHEIAIEAYGPLAPLTRATGGPIDGIVKQIAKDRGIEESQVLLKWAEQKTGGVLVTTSSNVERQKIQLEAVTKVSPLSDDEVEQISEAGKGRYFRAFMTDVWDAAKP
ncbi:aldose reductase [Kwoniella heveanensis CBS 569]|uniref:Aldose reductase n=1 Tax=Kwoniella heveanensis BCC8398 TaxID=1296120 RepID=A0A1B9GUE7_9TREE|nr:aldose reductase [Kwoniella heveanensis BCC8398]OCF45076.1 aldose reductase [Kwoniella heveanensis CBS 569]